LPPFHRRRHSFVDELKSKLPLLSFLFKMKKQWIQSNPTRRGEARRGNESNHKGRGGGAVDVQELDSIGGGGGEGDRRDQWESGWQEVGPARPVSRRLSTTSVGCGSHES
jgi:hypothetical protein